MLNIKTHFAIIEENYCEVFIKPNGFSISVQAVLASLREGTSWASVEHNLLTNSRLFFYAHKINHCFTEKY